MLYSVKFSQYNENTSIVTTAISFPNVWAATLFSHRSHKRVSTAGSHHNRKRTLSRRELLRHSSTSSRLQCGSSSTLACEEHNWLTVDWFHSVLPLHKSFISALGIISFGPADLFQRIKSNAIQRFLLQNIAVKILSVTGLQTKRVWIAVAFSNNPT